ncbi:MAG: FAD-binding oxidoreductase [Desulfobacteraceae bacterium]|nr:FAD-binding oxidoreductase [Desulfobacteraceae bacterium]MBC2756547.1 FAD-binding oxidoreductase [Desulfobacteraceae bacterium]
MTEIENPGINTENIEEAVKYLGEAIGEKWVSNDHAVLSSYSRDFTITPGNWPNIVVIPGSTEDVQKIFRIAYRHKIPVVPISSGFNHGGMCIPRKGGIMIDLIKRMDRVLDFDDETMTITIQPGVRNAVVAELAEQHESIPGVRKIIAGLPLTMGSGSTLSNYFCRGGASTMLKHGNTPESIVSMTMVLPDGEVLKTGPSAMNEKSYLPVVSGPGPNIAGMFINSSGCFGICTEMTIKLFPEPKLEEIQVFQVEDEDDPLIVEKIVDLIYRVTRLDICDFVYKTHGGALANGNPDPEVNREDSAEIMSEQILLIGVSGDDEEEIRIKMDIVTKMAEEAGCFKVMLEVFDEIFPDGFPFRREARMRFSAYVGGQALGGKGSFQWLAGNPKLELIPELSRGYEQLLEKYWKPTDPEYPRKRTMAGTAIQGPYPFGRCGTLEFDYWWDPSNVETVKKGTQMIKKAANHLIAHRVPLWRNMYDHGELHIPLLGTYFDLLKKTKTEFDPDNLMHPDQIPCTDDYI